MFATDIDAKAIEHARAGIYHLSAVADISPTRLSRYFTQDTDGKSYRIRKEISDLLIFSEQDVIKDPSFSKIDLISCRNLLIYMNTDLQKKILNLFHYSMNPGGLLFLGKSETGGGHQGLFYPLDRRVRLYRRKEPGFQPGNLEALKRIPAQTENFSANRSAGYQSANAELVISDKAHKITKEEIRLLREELETCKEELQSVNEELVAVNEELHAKITELKRAEQRCGKK